MGLWDTIGRFIFSGWYDDDEDTRPRSRLDTIPSDPNPSVVVSDNQKPSKTPPQGEEEAAPQRTVSEDIGNVLERCGPSSVVNIVGTPFPVLLGWIKQVLCPKDSLVVITVLIPDFTTPATQGSIFEIGDVSKSLEDLLIMAQDYPGRLTVHPTSLRLPPYVVLISIDHHQMVEIGLSGVFPFREAEYLTSLRGELDHFIRAPSVLTRAHIHPQKVYSNYRRIGETIEAYHLRIVSGDLTSFTSLRSSGVVTLATGYKIIVAVLDMGCKTVCTDAEEIQIMFSDLKIRLRVAEAINE
jgi:hypothetical protein